MPLLSDCMDSTVLHDVSLDDTYSANSKHCPRSGLQALRAMPLTIRGNRYLKETVLRRSLAEQRTLLSEFLDSPHARSHHLA